MELDKVIVTITGIALASFTYWYFLAHKDSIIEVAEFVDITVDGGYKPSTIKVPKGKEIRLNFFRRDPSSCLEEIVLPDFGKKAFLPLNQTTTIIIKPEKEGEYEISCGMNMFHGKVIVQ